MTSSRPARPRSAASPAVSDRIIAIAEPHKTMRTRPDEARPPGPNADAMTEGSDRSAPTVLLSAGAAFVLDTPDDLEEVL